MGIESYPHHNSLSITYYLLCGPELLKLLLLLLLKTKKKLGSDNIMSIQSQSVRTFWNGGEVATSNLVYNASNGQNATTGWIDCRYDNVVLQYALGTQTCATVLMKVEGRFAKSGVFTRPASILATLLQSVTTDDILFDIDKKFREIRVGAKCFSTTSTNPLYAAVCLTDSN